METNDISMIFSPLSKKTCKQHRSEKNISVVAQKNLNIMKIYQTTYKKAFKFFTLEITKEIER
jgi:hypothetical protein